MIQQESMTKKPAPLFPEPRREMAFTRGGKTYIGRWILADGMVTVWVGVYGPHSTQLGGMPPEALARLLLNELVDGAEVLAKTK